GWAALIGAVIGGLFVLGSGFFLQWRADRRRMLGAGRVVLVEIARNAGALEAYFEHSKSELSSRAGRDGLRLLSMGYETRAWDVHNADLAFELDDDTIGQLEDVYHHLRR